MRYYVYLLCYPVTEVPFYIGKGSKNRVDDHEQIALSGGVGELYDIIRKIQLEGKSPIKVKVYFTDDEKDAYDEEDRLIRKYGLDNLANRIESAGRIIRDLRKWKENIGRAAKGRIPWNKGKPMSEEQKLKDSLSHIGKVSSRKGKTLALTDQQRSARSNAHKGQFVSIETRIKHSISTTARHRDPEMHEKMVNGIRKYWSDPANDIKAKERVIKGWVTRRNKNK